MESLIYTMANKIFNLHLRTKLLILCDCFVLLMNNRVSRFVIGFAGFVGFVIGFVGFAGTLGVLVISAILFSCFIAYYNEHEEKMLNEAGNSNHAHDCLEGKIRLGKIEFKMNIRTIKSNTANNFAIENQPEKWAEVIPENGELVEYQTKESFTTLESDLENKVESEEFLIDIESKNKETVADLKSNGWISSVAVLEDYLEITDTEAIEIEQKTEVKAEKLPENESVLAERDCCSSLDELLDYAFTKKDALQLTIALKAFTKALSLCKDTNLAPMVIVEMSNIFKAQGQYEQAIQLFSEGRNLPYVLENDTLNQQFIEMIAFLRIIKNNLLEHQNGFVPYDKIPSDVMHKINEEFHHWLTSNCTKLGG